MKKLGSVDKEKFSFIPLEEDINDFRRNKISELKKQFPKRNIKQPQIPF